MCHTEGLHDRAEMSRARCIAQGLTVIKIFIYLTVQQFIYMYIISQSKSLMEGEIIIIWNDLCSNFVTSKLRLHSHLSIR